LMASSVCVHRVGTGWGGGGWSDDAAFDPLPPTRKCIGDRNANHADNVMIRLAGPLAVDGRLDVHIRASSSESATIMTSALLGRFIRIRRRPIHQRQPYTRPTPDRFLPAVPEHPGDFFAFQLISNTSYYRSAGTQVTTVRFTTSALPDVRRLPGVVPFPLLDGTGIHLPSDISNRIARPHR